MSTRRSAYRPIVALRPGTDEPPVTLDPVPLDARNGAAGSITEEELQNLLFEHPQALPIADIDASYDNLVPVCKELSVPSGYVDALYVNSMGKLTLVEFKLWRNHGARRKVIGQILDYAKDLITWNYDDLQHHISLARKRSHSTPDESNNILYELVYATDPTIDEHAFVDNVLQYLRKGEFLLLIVGDGIRKEVVNIVDFMQQHSGLHFNLALVEAALYRDGDRLIVQPRILAQTEILRQHIGFSTDPDSEDVEKDDPYRKEEYLRFWEAVFDEFSFFNEKTGVPIKIDIPEPKEYSNIHINDKLTKKYGIWFGVSLNRGKTKVKMGCYLARNDNNQDAIDLFDRLVDDSSDKLGGETWKDTSKKQRPRFGFRCEESLEGDDYFDDAVEWIRKHLNILVSALYLRLQEIDEEDS